MTDEVERLTRERDALQRAFNAVRVERDRLTEMVIHTEAEVERLREALHIQDPRNSSERFTLIADAFEKETGLWAPGRFRPAAMGGGLSPDEEGARHVAWRKFCNEWHERFFDKALRAELAGGGDE